MQEFEFVSAGSLEEAVSLLAEPGSRPIAGGTDVIPRLQRGLFPAGALVDLTHIPGLAFIREQDGAIHVGGLTTYADLLASPLLAEAAPLLVEAVATIGCPQTRYRGTIGGNVANASPAGDTLPPLLALDARARLIGPDGARVVPLADVLRGPGQTCLAAGEVLHSIAFERLPRPFGSAFLKLGKRRGMNIAVASAAAALVMGSDGRIAQARVAFGSVAPTAVRSASAEQALIAGSPTEETFARAAGAAMADIHPISDVRGSADYRRHSAGVLLRRALKLAAQRAEGASA